MSLSSNGCTTDPQNSNINNNKKRKADTLGRLSVSQSRAGRGAEAGWTLCPLCHVADGNQNRRRRQRQYALGRGISAHLHAVHAPWKQQPQDPKQEQIAAWDQKVLEIVAELDKKAAALSGNATNTSAGVDRNGRPAKKYRESLPPFIKAAADGDLSALQQMVADVYDDDDDDDDIEIIIKLLSSRDRHMSTAEHWASGGGHLECLRYLIALRDKYIRGESAVILGNTDKKVRRRDGKTSLHYAARNGQLMCVQYLIDEQNHSVDEVSGDGTTPLHLACFGAHVEVVEYLIAQGAEVMAVNEWGCSAAHWIGMTVSQSLEDIRKICSLLQNLGVSFSKRQKQGHSAFHKAAQKRNKHVLEWLLQSATEGGAGLSDEEIREACLEDDGGHTPCEIWTASGGDESFARLLSAFGHVNAPDTKCTDREIDSRIMPMTAADVH